MNARLPSSLALLDATRQIAAEVAVPHATSVDAQARFPAETVAALRAVAQIASMLLVFKDSP